MYFVRLGFLTLTLVYHGFLLGQWLWWKHCVLLNTNWRSMALRNIGRIWAMHRCIFRAESTCIGQDITSYDILINSIAQNLSASCTQNNHRSKCSGAQTVLCYYYWRSGYVFFDIIKEQSRIPFTVERSRRRCIYPWTCHHHSIIMIHLAALNSRHHLRACCNIGSATCWKNLYTT